MSETFLRIFPADPLSPVPQAEKLGTALQRLREMLRGADEVETNSEPLPFAIDAGGNWMGVYCPHCNADLDDWWGDAMHEWWKNDRERLAVTTPCCSLETTLDRLRYAWPFGFGRFVIDVRSAPRELSADEIDSIGNLLNVPLRTLWRRL